MSNTELWFIVIGVFAVLVTAITFLYEWWDARREAARKRKRASHA